MFFLGWGQLLCCPDFAAAARGHLEELQEVLAIEETSVFRCGVFGWVQRKLVDLHMAKCFVPERLNMVLGTPSVPIWVSQELKGTLLH